MKRADAAVSDVRKRGWIEDLSLANTSMSRDSAEGIRAVRPLHGHLGFLRPFPHIHPFPTNNFMLPHGHPLLSPQARLSLGDVVTNAVILDGAMKDRIR